MKVPGEVIQTLADLRQWLQDKCEPPVYVSDRRLVKAVALMQVGWGVAWLCLSPRPCLDSTQNVTVSFMLPCLACADLQVTSSAQRDLWQIRSLVQACLEPLPHPSALPRPQARGCCIAGTL